MLLPKEPSSSTMCRGRRPRGCPGHRPRPRPWRVPATLGHLVRQPDGSPPPHPARHILPLPLSVVWRRRKRSDLGRLGHAARRRCCRLTGIDNHRSSKLRCATPHREKGVDPGAAGEVPPCCYENREDLSISTMCGRRRHHGRNGRRPCRHPRRVPATRRRSCSQRRTHTPAVALSETQL